MSLLGETKRRKIFQVAAVYAVVAWLIMQVVDVVNEPLNLPEWFDTSVIVALAIGLPIAIVLAWAFDLTPEGVIRDEGTIQHRGRTIEYVLIGLLVVALSAVILDSYLRTDRDPLEGLVDVSEPVPGFSNRAAIAVLPFSNLSGDPDQDYFSDGITQEIITELSSIRTFPVIAGTSTFPYKESVPGAREIAADLGVGYILEGSVRRNENQVRITALLNDASGRQIWGETYDSEFRDILAVQDEIARQIIGAIEPELISSEINLAARVRTEDMEAWNYYLQAAANATSLGGAYADRNGQPVTVERTDIAVELARQAIVLDREFADAYTMLGHILATYSRQLRPQVGDDFADLTLQEAMENARQGYQRNPYSATTCSCYVAFLGWEGPEEELNIQAALRIQEEAVRINPSNAFAHSMLAQVYQNLERHPEAFDEIRLAKRLSPRDVNFSHFLSVEAFTHMSMGDWESAANLAHSATTLRPLNYHGHATRIVSLYAGGDREGATAALRELTDSVPDFSVDMVWNFPSPVSLANVLSPLTESWQITRYREAVAAVLDELKSS